MSEPAELTNTSANSLFKSFLAGNAIGILSLPAIFFIALYIASDVKKVFVLGILCFGAVYLFQQFGMGANFELVLDGLFSISNAALCWIFFVGPKIEAESKSHLVQNENHIPSQNKYRMPIYINSAVIFGSASFTSFMIFHLLQK